MTTRRRRYLVTYDIADDKRRSKVFQTCRDHGDHAQYSVFICELTKMELTHMLGLLNERIHQLDDQILVLDLGVGSDPLEKGMQCLGKGYKPVGRVLVV